MQLSENKKSILVRIIYSFLLWFYPLAYAGYKCFVNRFNSLNLFNKISGFYSSSGLTPDFYHRNEFLAVLEPFRYEFVVGMVWFLVLLAMVAVNRKWLKILLWVTSFAGLWLYFIDIGTVRMVESHVMFAEITEFASQAKHYTDLIDWCFHCSIGKFAILFSLYLITLLIYNWLVRFPGGRYFRRMLVSGVIGLCFGIFIFKVPSIGNNQDFLGSLAYNVYQVNSNYEFANYSAQYRPFIEFKNEYTLIGEPSKKKNVIFVEVESLSSNVSNYFSGINNYMGEFDKIAAESLAFTNYYANGYSTAKSIFAMLSGYPFLFKNINVRDDKFYEHSAINFLKSQGYTNYLFHTEAPDANIDHIHEIYDKVSFDSISNRSDNFYKGLKADRHNRLADEFLFANVAKNVKAGLSEPYFVMISTLSTHEPFQVPGTNRLSYSEVYKYTDRQIGIFVEQLRQSGFFENGILIITGDHHPRMAVSIDEINRFGSKARLMVPLLIYDGGQTKGKMEMPFDHPSLGSLIEYQALGQYEKNEFMQDPANPTNDYPIIYQPYWPRDEASLYWHDQEYKINLAGDKTSITNLPESLDQNKILGYLAWIRSGL